MDKKNAVRWLMDDGSCTVDRQYGENYGGKPLVLGSDIAALVAALDVIRRGRTANATAYRLSDTEMAKIANNALTSLGLGAKLSPQAESTLA